MATYRFFKDGIDYRCTPLIERADTEGLVLVVGTEVVGVYCLDDESGRHMLMV
jgi:hypothetical protein